MSNTVSPFIPTERPDNVRALWDQFPAEMKEIASFKLYLAQKLKYTHTSSKSSAKLTAKRYQNLHASLLRLHSDCSIILSGQASAKELNLLINKKDLYFHIDDPFKNTAEKSTH